MVTEKRTSAETAAISRAEKNADAEQAEDDASDENNKAVAGVARRSA
jgi:hypothetical protein